MVCSLSVEEYSSEDFNGPQVYCDYGQYVQSLR